MKKIIYILLCIVSAASCKPQNDAAEYAEPVTEPVISSNNKTVSDNKENDMLVSKGTIVSVNDVPVYSRLQAQIVRYNVLEGLTVRKGETLFGLDDEDIRSEISILTEEYEKAKFKLDDILVGQGYKKDDYSGIPETIMELAKVKSGLNVAETKLEIAKNQLSRTSVKAPISGTVTDIRVPQYSYAVPGEMMCRIVDTEHLKVVFSILESEIGRFYIGKEVEVRSIAYSGETHSAKISAISPLVDENGMIRIEAILNDSNNLMPGMSALIK